MPFENLAGIMQCMENRAFSSAVGPEKQRDGAEIELYSIADALEVFNRNTCDHIGLLIGLVSVASNASEFQNCSCDGGI